MFIPSMGVAPLSRTDRVITVRVYSDNFRTLVLSTSAF